MFEGDIKMTGTHASYIKFLASKSNQLNKDALTAGVFKRYIDVYIAGAIIGDENILPIFSFLKSLKKFFFLIS